MALNTPAALAHHIHGMLFQTATSSELTMVRSAFWLGKSRQDQSKPRAVLVELISVAAKHTAFRASKRLRDLKIRLDKDLTPQQMKTRRGLYTDFQCLKARVYKPFFRGPTLSSGSQDNSASATQAATGSNSRVLQWPWTLWLFCTSMASV
ncbi:TPA: hypothetical protein ACH3X1_015356 [Trebouxia sp. C0004]